LISGTSRVSVPPARSTIASRAPADITTGSNCTMYSLPLAAAEAAGALPPASAATAAATNAALFRLSTG
jgi:hypothetical protein